MPSRKEKEEIVDAKKVPVGKVYYEKSLTKNMGDYNSAKVTVGVELPIFDTDKYRKNVESAISVCDDLVTAELTIQIEELTK